MIFLIFLALARRHVAQIKANVCGMLFNLSAHAHDKAASRSNTQRNHKRNITTGIGMGGSGCFRVVRGGSGWLWVVQGGARLTTGILCPATTAAATTIRTNDNNATMNCTRR